jgi:CRP-like cAMP-binding protein
MLCPMAPDSKRDLLHSIPLFGRLGRRELERLSQLTDEVDVPAGRVLMRQGDLGSEMFIIASGRVSVELDGKPRNDLGAGSWFGEIALLCEGPRTATVTTADPSRLFVVGHREFHALMDEMLTVRVAVFQVLADRLCKAEAHTVN